LQGIQTLLKTSLKYLSIVSSQDTNLAIGWRRCHWAWYMCRIASLHIHGARRIKNLLKRPTQLFFFHHFI